MVENLQKSLIISHHYILPLPFECPQFINCKLDFKCWKMRLFQWFFTTVQKGWISLYNCTVGSRLGKMPKRGALAKKCSSKSSNEDRCDPHFFVSLTHLFRRNCHFWDILSEAFYWHILSETFRVRHFVEWYIFETFWVRHFIASFWVRHFKWDIFWDILSETFNFNFEENNS